MTAVNVRIVDFSEYNIQISHADVLKKQSELAISFVEAAKLLAKNIDISFQNDALSSQQVHIDGLSSLLLT